MKKRTKWLLALLISAVLSGLLIPAVYVRLVDPPSALREQALPAGIIALSDLEGSWRIADGSIVGYRVREQIGLSKTEGVGRTEAIEGAFEISGETLVAAVFTVDMATLVSDRSQRDDQVRGRILETATFPNASFELGAPVSLLGASSEGEAKTQTVGGNLTLRGVTKYVQVLIRATSALGQLRLTGETEVVFSEWGIPNPSLPAALIFTADRGLLEFDLLFEPDL